MTSSSQPLSFSQFRPHHTSFFLAGPLVLAVPVATYHLCTECSNSQHPANQSAQVSYPGVSTATPVHSGDNRQMLFFRSHTLPHPRMLLHSSSLMPCSITRTVHVPCHPKAQPSPQRLPYPPLDLSVWLCLTVAAPFLPPFPGKILQRITGHLGEEC